MTGFAGEMTEQAHILIVDDLPEKLLVFRTVLEDLGQPLVFARSGTEALKEVLAREFAVILLDVNMPDIDGFETASLIRRHRRSAHTPIIFITSYADELQTARGYSLGAVDYILSPVVPEILRSKVRVFVELHVLQKRIARQAEERIALAASAAALAVAEDAQRRSACLSEVSHALSGVLDPGQVLQALQARAVPVLAGGVSLLAPGDELAQAGQGRGAGAGPAAVQDWPLRQGDHTLGLLRFDAPTAMGEALGPEVAERVAVALAAAHLHQELQAEIAERRQAEARLAEASRRKDEFIAMLSHELRNPLAPIRNAAEVIRRVAPEDKTLRWASDITDRQVRQLTRLVDELLDVARISQGKIVLQRAPLDLAALVADCVDAQRSAITARRQTLTQAVSSVPVWVNGDADRLRQVVGNLLSNAIKYTPEGGGLHVGIGLDGGQALLTVRDTGMGIEPDLLPRVFELFEQGPRTLDRSQGGLGIGLTLVQLLVQLHGGRVEAHSAGTGQGSEFRIWLPTSGALAAPAPAPAVEAPVVPHRHILLVEDNVDVADTTATMLRLSGHTVCVVHGGAEAIDAVAGFTPDVVLLDIGLPHMDGYEVARRLRHTAACQGAWLVALTGYGQPADRQRGRDAGFDEHLLKPVDPSALDEIIARSARPAGSAPAGATLYRFGRP
ncbi:response regulator [Ideonella sp.]|uniref:response regulator n=1 Tax=Ideonella sp. TaxID=1929293 RepID=UPI0035B27C54